MENNYEAYTIALVAFPRNPGEIRSLEILYTHEIFQKLN